MTLFTLSARKKFQPLVTERHLQTEVAHCVGGVVSSVLANLFLHYAFDAWMAREHPPAVRFERYVDDAVVHCVSERQARMLATAIADRLAQVGLRLHPTKTRIVYCKDGKRRGDHEHTSFTFLGFTFRARRARGRGRNFTSFLPAISNDALHKASAQVRSWRLHLRTGHTLTELAHAINPIVRGWMGVLRRVLQLRAASPPQAHQRLPAALAPQEIQAAARVQAGQAMLGRHHQP